MISDSAGHVAKNWSGLPTGRKSQCIPAQRAFLSSSSIFFSLFSSTVNVWLSGQMHEESQNDSYHLSLLLAARLADRSCLSWDREGLVQLSYEPLQEPLCLFHKPFWSHQKQTPPKKYKQKTKMQTQQPMATKEFKTEKKKKSETSKREKRREKKALAFNIKLFQDRVSFLLFWWLSF